MDEVEQDTSMFNQCFGIAQVSGLMAVVLTGVWVGHFRGGVSWTSNPSTQFNWHPLLMVLGMVYLYGNGILTYRALRNERKRKLKLVHACVMFGSFILACIGLRAVFDFHEMSEKGPVPNLYSLHSWIGIITVILFTFQWFGGLVTFLFPGLASHLRESYLPIHMFFGMLIFGLACATALIGITEKAIFAMGDDYQNKPPEGMLMNWIGLLIALFGALVIYLVANPRYKRLTKPEDEMLLQETN